VKQAASQLFLTCLAHRYVCVDHFDDIGARDQALPAGCLYLLLKFGVFPRFALKVFYYRTLPGGGTLFGGSKMVVVRGRAIACWIKNYRYI